jgi:hypothetical protein
VSNFSLVIHPAGGAEAAREDGNKCLTDYFLEILKDQVATLRGDMDSKTRQLMDKFEKSSRENVAKLLTASAEAAVKRRKKTGRKGFIDRSDEFDRRNCITSICKRYTRQT